MNTKLLIFVDFQIIFSWIEQILDFLIVNFDKADFDWELDILWLSYDLLEKSSDHSGNDSALLLIFDILARHGVSFTWTSLPIGQYGSIVSIEDAIHYWTDSLVVDLLLSGVHIVDLIIVIRNRLLLACLLIDAHQWHSLLIRERAANFLSGCTQFPLIEWSKPTVYFHIAILGVFIQRSHLFASIWSLSFSISLPILGRSASHGAPWLICWSSTLDLLFSRLSLVIWNCDLRGLRPHGLELKVLDGYMLGWWL